METFKYLENEIRTSIINEIRDVAYYHSRRRNIKSAGYFSIPRSVFCYIDHLGYIAFGDDSSTNRSIKFIKEFFPTNYHKFSELIYSMWRHGTVHQYKAISYYASYPNNTPTKINVKWLSTIHNKNIERNQNLLPHPMQGKKDTVYIVINTCQLVDDLIIALDKFIEKLRNDTSWESQCLKRIETINKIQDYSTIKGKIVALAVKNQIKLAWDLKDGLLDNKGNIVKFLRK